jgi:hypothetical protein
MTPRTLADIPQSADRSNWTLRMNRSLADAGLRGFVSERGDRKVAWFAYLGWIGLAADMVWRML